MKRIIVIALSVMLAILLAVPAFAENDPAISMENVTGKSGETVSMTVSLTNFPAVSSVYVEYSAQDSLQPVRTAHQWLLEGKMKDFDSVQDHGVWGAENVTDVSVNGNALSLAFQVPEYVPGQSGKEYTVTVKIRAKTADNVEYTATTTAKVLVSNPAVDMTITGTQTLDLKEGQQETLSAALNPANSTDTVTWESKDPSIASVDPSTGVVTPHKRGSVEIKATAGSVSKVCIVTVTCAHELKEVAPAQPSCQTTGNNLYYTCEVDGCGAIIASNRRTETTVEAQQLGTVPCSGGTATCLEKAICSMCGNPYGATAPHDLEHTSAKIPNCHEKGNVEYWTCGNDCCAGKIYGNELCTVELTKTELDIDPTFHQGGTEVRNAKTENCYQPGYTGDTYCLGCQTKTATGQPVEATGEHVAGEQWYTNGEKHWHLCTTQGCGAKVEEKAHDFTWEVDKHATEDETGLKHEECVCGVKRNENTEIPKQDHKHVDIKHFDAVKATCVKEGTVEYWTCGSSKCAGKYYGDEACQTLLETIVEAVDPEHHTGKTEVKDKKAATCSEPGYSGDTYCADCGVMVKKGSVVAATGKHTGGAYQSDEVSHWKNCTVCGQLIASTKKAHSFQWIVEQEATEEAAGKQHEECSDCHRKRSENTEIPKLEHTPVLVEGKAPTCTEDGVASHFYCDNCGKYQKNNDGKPGDVITQADTVLKATGHSFAESWESSAEGHWHLCACGEKSAMEAHTEKIINTKDATEEEPGYTGDTVCGVCGHKIKEGQQIPALEKPFPVGVVIVIMLVLAAGAITAVVILKKRKVQA